VKVLQSSQVYKIIPVHVGLLILYKDEKLRSS